MAAPRRRRVVHDRSSLVEEGPRKSVLEVVAPAETRSEEEASALREMAEMQAASPGAFAEMMRAAAAGEAAEAAWARAQRGELELPSERVLGPDGSTRPSASKGKRITPEPWFALKTRGRTKGVELRAAEEGEVKYFINVCCHPEVAEPAETKRLDDDGEEVEGYSVPVAIGPEKRDRDAKGQACVVVDCVVHPSFVVDDKKDFLCHLAMTYVEKKYHLELDRDYKLPKLKYKGDVVTEQAIRDGTTFVREVPAPPPPKPIEAELGPPPTLAAAAVDGVARPIDDSWPGVSTSARELTVDLECPTWRGLAIAHSAFALRVDVPGRRRAVFALPLGVVAASARLLHRRGHRLRLRFEVDHAFYDAPDPGSKPFGIARAVSRHAREREPEPAPTDAYHLKPHQRAPPHRVEQPPKGASAAELAYAAAEIARLAAESAAVVADDDVLDEDKFHKADIVSQHYISQRQAQAHDKRDDDPPPEASLPESPPSPPRDGDHPPLPTPPQDGDPSLHPIPDALLATFQAVPLQSTLWAELL